MWRPSASGAHWSMLAHRRPHSDQHARQRRFARRRRPDHAERLAAVQREIDILANDRRAARHRDCRALHDQRARRRLQRHRRILNWKVRQQIRKPRPALPRGDKAAPIGDRKIDRRQRAAAQDRAGDDDARRR
jgi:hypothetical protein